MDDETADTPRAVSDPDSAFGVLSHDLRLDILLALWDAPGFSLSFSELRTAVGERDSGSFAYHLSELQDHFVVQTDEGYELQYPGHRVLDAIQSGVFHEQATVGPVDVDGNCRDCGGSLTFAYDTDYIARVHCADCTNRVLEWPFDPGGVADRDPEAVVGAFDRRTRLIWSCALDGVCPFCAGRIDRTFASQVHELGTCIGVVEQLDRYDEYFARDHPATVAVDCDRCSFYSFVPVGVLLLTRPAVTGRLSRAGIDVRETPLWDLGFAVDADALSLRGTDPMTVAVTARGGDEPVTVVVDDELSVSVEAVD